MERLAVIDMGSNSWRLVVYGYEPGGAWSLIDELRAVWEKGATPQEYWSRTAR